MTKPITIKISGIKCDSCDYKDDSVDRENYLEYVNKECPDCGNILLTQREYDEVSLIEGVVANFDLDIPQEFMEAAAIVEKMLK